MHRFLVFVVTLTALLLAVLPTAPGAVLVRGVPPEDIGPGATVAAEPSDIPLFGTDFADPFVLPVAGSYYAFATGRGSVNVQVIHSDDLRSWSAAVDALPTLPAWVEPGHTWAPAILPTRDAFVLYYSARDRKTGLQCISWAVARQPAGPFTDQSIRPFICPPGGAIDAQPFVGADGDQYLHWRGYHADGSGILRGQRLTREGRALFGEPVTLLEATQRWQGAVVEAPFMVRVGSRHLLLYSGNGWDSAGYAAGYAVCRGPLGPCSDVREAPFLASSPVGAGPGGQSVFAGPGGNLMMAYHAWRPGSVGYETGGSRLLHITAFTLR